MLPLFVFGILYAFLFAGAVLYLMAIAARPTRPYALSAALWVAALGPCILGVLTVAGLGAILQSFVTQSGYISPRHLPNLETLGSIYVFLGLFGSIIVATGAAFLHQILIHRFTLILFRLYVTTVSAGVGGTLALGLSWYMLLDLHPHWSLTWMLLAPVFAGLLGTFAYRSARSFRGSLPKRFPWVTHEEFSGLPTA